MKITAVVEQKLVNKGSKNEHLAFIINYGDSYLRLKRENFGLGDDYFKQFLGQTLEIEGRIIKKLLFVDKINDLAI